MSSDSMGDIANLIREQADELRALKAEISRLRFQQTSPQTMTILDAAQTLGCGRTQVFKLLKAGQLTPAPKVGRQRLVTTASVQALLVPVEIKPTGRQQAPRHQKPAKDWKLRVL